MIGVEPKGVGWLSIRSKGGLVRPHLPLATAHAHSPSSRRLSAWRTTQALLRAVAQSPTISSQKYTSDTSSDQNHDEAAFAAQQAAALPRRLARMASGLTTETESESDSDSSDSDAYTTFSESESEEEGQAGSDATLSDTDSDTRSFSTAEDMPLFPAARWGSPDEGGAPSGCGAGRVTVHVAFTQPHHACA